jgi:hypothetical protein
MIKTRLLHARFILWFSFFVMVQSGPLPTAAASPTIRAQGNAVSASGAVNAASLPDTDGAGLPARGDVSGKLRPDTVDAWLQQAKIAASDGTGGDYFGRSVSLTTDGNMALVGANGANTSMGAAYVFTRSGEIWTQQARLTASDGATFKDFGYSVALNSDGSAAIVGSPGMNAAYVFVRSGSSWSQQAKLSSMPQENEGMGNAVAISSDGNTAIIGAPGKNNGRGAAYVYTRSGTDWSFQRELTDSSSEEWEYFGNSVTLGDNGSTALIGAHVKGSNRGSAFVFIRLGTNWNQQAELIASDATPVYFFGASVSLNSAGSLALVGAKDSNSSRGAAYIFSRSGSTWTQQAKLTALDGAVLDQLGWSSALSSDGGTAILGGFDVSTPSLEVAYIFRGSGTTWSQQARLHPSLAGDSAFGVSVALDGDGTTALVGACGTYQFQGAGYLFTLSLPTPVVTTSTVSSITQETASGGGNVTSDGGGGAVTARGVCWGTSPNPVYVLGPGCTSDGAGTGLFTSSITGLSAITAYHVRAYATNPAGTAYGEDISFTTNLCAIDVQRGLGTSYGTIQDAVSSGSGPEIKAVARVFQESLSFTNNSDLTLSGGYACGLGSISGVTTINGSMTFAGSGTLILANVAVY